MTDQQPTNPNSRYKWILAGSLFAILWASASTATKIGLSSAQPLVIAVVRFGIAATIMLVIAHIFNTYRLPSGKEWKQLTIYGLLNITIYLGFYVIAMQTVTAGIGSLAVATNPIFISFFSVFTFKKKLKPIVVWALFICTAGVLCAAWPLFSEASVTTGGLLILVFSMLAYSAGAIYFAAKPWGNLHLFAINGWQTLIGGLFLLPFALYFYKDRNNHFDLKFWYSVFWLAIPVSILAVLLWLWLLRANPVKAGLWLFLCPIFGFAIAAWLVKDHISSFTILGVLLVMFGLFLTQRNSLRKF